MLFCQIVLATHYGVQGFFDAPAAATLGAKRSQPRATKSPLVSWLGDGWVGCLLATRKWTASRLELCLLLCLLVGSDRPGSLLLKRDASRHWCQIIRCQQHWKNESIWHIWNESGFFMHTIGTCDHILSWYLDLLANRCLFIHPAASELIVIHLQSWFWPPVNSWRTFMAGYLINMHFIHLLVDVSEKCRKMSIQLKPVIFKSCENFQNICKLFLNYLANRVRKKKKSFLLTYWQQLSVKVTGTVVVVLYIVFIIYLWMHHVHSVSITPFTSMWEITNNNNKLYL